MTAYKITSFDSVFTAAGSAFEDGTAGPDSLTVDESAFLVTTDNAAEAAFLGGTGAWSVTVNGTIFSKGYVGLFVHSTLPANITIGSSGEIGSGTFDGIHASLGAVNIRNAGLIRGGGSAIQLLGDGNSSITNTGLISGDILAAFADAVTITNSGSIENGDITLGKSNDKVTNTGRIEGGIFFDEGNNTYGASSATSFARSISAGAGNDVVSIAGDIGRTVLLGNGNNKFTLTKTGTVANALGAPNAVVTGNGDDIFSNAGLIFGGVALGDGNNSFTNSGQINGDITSINGTTAKFTNSGTINGNIGFSIATTTISNTGTINGSLNGSTIADTLSNTKVIAGPVTLNDGNDVVMNSGTIDTLSLGAGDDKLTNTGTITSLDLGDGNDIYTGGSGRDSIDDSDGGDNVKLGAGNDRYGAIGAVLDKTDTIDGGTGIDEYEVDGTVEDIFVNLDIVERDTAILNGPSVKIAAKSANGIGVGKDTITGFEDVKTSAGDDIIFGNSAANVLDGFHGNDSLFGLGGNDTLLGGINNDLLVGGAGADRLVGSNGVDHFIYLTTADSGITKATRDLIEDFEDGQDKINLSLIDANTKNGSAAHDSFDYINIDSSVTPSAMFTKGTPGQLRSYWTVTGYMIEGDVNGDGKADFSIAIDDADHSIVLTAPLDNSGDFILT